MPAVCDRRMPTRLCGLSAPVPACRDCALRHALGHPIRLGSCLDPRGFWPKCRLAARRTGLLGRVDVTRREGRRQERCNEEEGRGNWKFPTAFWKTTKTNERGVAETRHFGSPILVTRLLASGMLPHSASEC
jgi:hypothetical protein